MVVSSTLLAYVLLTIDYKFDLKQYKSLNWLTFATAEGARAVLSTVAAATFSAAALIFSVTMVVLSLASSQYGPKILKNLLRDYYSQFTFGAFISTFIYCLFVLRGIDFESNIIPNLSASTAIVMILLDSVLFVIYIHYIMSSIRAEKIIGDIYESYNKKINSDINKSIAWHPPSETQDQDYLLLSIDKQGYVQAINYDKLTEFAEEEDILIELLCRPGEILLKGAVVAKIYPKIYLKNQVQQCLNESILVGDEPTEEQDPVYYIKQLVQIAARALSPSINDPFTANNCIDYLARGISEIASAMTEQETPIKNHDENHGLIIKKLEFEDLVNLSFDIIREMALANPPVILHMINVFGQLIWIAPNDDYRKYLLEYIESTVNAAQEKIVLKEEKKQVTKAMDILKSLLTSVPLSEN